MSGVRFLDGSRRALLAAGGAIAVSAALRPAFAQGKMKIGVIGSGKIGGTVGRLWVKDGHPVLFSSRHPEELAGLVKEAGPLAKAGTVAEAIAFGDALLLAIPYGAYPAFGRRTTRRSRARSCSTPATRAPPATASRSRPRSRKMASVSRRRNICRARGSSAPSTR